MACDKIKDYCSQQGNIEEEEPETLKSVYNLTDSPNLCDENEDNDKCYYGTCICIEGSYELEFEGRSLPIRKANCIWGVPIIEGAIYTFKINEKGRVEDANIYKWPEDNDNDKYGACICIKRSDPKLYHLKFGETTLPLEEGSCLAGVPIVENAIYSYNIGTDGSVVNAYIYKWPIVHKLSLIHISEPTRPY